MKHKKTWRWTILTLIAILIFAISACAFFSGRRPSDVNSATPIDVSVEAWVNLMPVVLHPGESPPKARGHIILELKGIKDVKLASLSVLRTNGDTITENPKFEIREDNTIHISGLELSASDSIFVVLELETGGKRIKLKSPTAIVKAVY